MSTVENLLVARHLCKRFGARQVVTGISLQVCAGDIVGLVGANGGGKTTTLRMLGGLLSLTSGSGEVLGFDLQDHTRQIRERVGYMPQGASFYPSLSVRENLRFRAAAFSVPNPRQVVEQSLRDSGLQQFAALHAERLSGGWARLLQLAGALIHRPALLLLDEPTAGLDVAHRHEVWSRIAALARSGVGVLLSTHDLAEAERCAQIMLLSTGVAMAAGAPRAVIADARIAVLAVAGDHALELAAQLSAQSGVLATYTQGKALRVVVDANAERTVNAQIEKLHLVATAGTPTLEDATLALLRHRQSFAG